MRLLILQVLDEISHAVGLGFVFSKIRKYCVFFLHFVPLYMMFNMLIAGFPSGSTNQVSPLPWPVQFIPHQALLHIKHPHYPTECTCI